MCNFDPPKISIGFTFLSEKIGTVEENPSTFTVLKADDGHKKKIKKLKKNTSW